MLLLDKFISLSFFKRSQTYNSYVWYCANFFSFFPKLIVLDRNQEKLSFTSVSKILMKRSIAEFLLNEYAGIYLTIP